MLAAPKTAVSGLLDFLEAKPGVNDVRVKYGKPATPAEITTWEQMNHCSLPQDLQSCYITHNGFSLKWSYQCNDSVFNIGEISVHALAQLVRICPTTSDPTVSHSLAAVDIANTYASSAGDSWRPSLSGPCRAFSLSYCHTCGHTCLVYHNAETHDSPSVWLLDLSLSWHFLSPSFSDYLRLAVVHLGLYQWPYALTSNGLSQQYQQWFYLFIPNRLELDLAMPKRHNLLQCSPTASSASTDSAAGLNDLDITKLLKATKDKRSKDVKSLQAQQKRK